VNRSVGWSFQAEAISSLENGSMRVPMRKLRKGSLSEAVN
jgi:hypothetical protein